jgi:cellulose synthase/poly-beta-1,6-N-acetylglucosamine synthase-like glycosyltransferase
MMFIAEIILWLSLSAVVYTYVGYPLLLVCCHLVYRRQASKPDASSCPSVSIVLAAFNEARCIRAKIENCLSLDYPRERLQILVGSDGSQDGTNQIAAEFRDRGVELFEFKPRSGKMATVNRLVARASGDICVFSDISEVFDLDALRKLTRHFADPGIGAVTGNHIYRPTNTGLGKGTAFYWKFQRFLQGIESCVCSICACDGTIYACRRKLFPHPPDDTINDDVAVPLSVIGRGKRIIFESEAIARGEVLSETRQFFRQKIRSQAGQYQLFSRFPQMFIPWPPHRWWIFISHSVLPVLVPWCLVFGLIANFVLCFSGLWLYQLLLILQASFYLLAAVGWIGDELRFDIPLVAFPFYFVTANIGSLCGCFAYFSGMQKAAWRKVD